MSKQDSFLASYKVEYEKIWTRKNSVFGHFSHSVHTFGQHKTQQMCEKIISKNSRMLQCIPIATKLKKSLEKQFIIVSIHWNMLLIATWLKSCWCTYSCSLIHVSNCYKTQKMCEKVVNICLFMLECVRKCYKS